MNDQDRLLLTCLSEINGFTAGEIVRSMGKCTNVRSEALILRRDLERLMGKGLMCPRRVVLTKRLVTASNG